VTPYLQEILQTPPPEASGGGLRAALLRAAADAPRLQTLVSAEPGGCGLPQRQVLQWPLGGGTANAAVTAWRRVRPYDTATSSLANSASALTATAGMERHHPLVCVEAPARTPGTVAAHHSNSINPQVSNPSAQTSCLPHVPANKYSKPLEVVRVQRHLLQEGTVDGTAQGSEDDEMWTSAHVVMDYVNFRTNSRTLKLRYGNGDEEGVCEGAVDRPERHKVVTRKASYSRDHTTSRALSLADHLRWQSSPPPAYDGHSSSIDKGSLGLSSSDCGVESASIEDERIAKSSNETLSNAIGKNTSRRQRGATKQGNEYAGSDSEATEWESEFKRRKAGRRGEAESQGGILHVDQRRLQRPWAHEEMGEAKVVCSFCSPTVMTVQTALPRQPLQTCNSPAGSRGVALGNHILLIRGTGHLRRVNRTEMQRPLHRRKRERPKWRAPFAAQRW
jgi:hypothetical protein